MREIKFRAQDFTKTWKYGYVAIGNESAVLFPKMKDGSVMIDIQIYVLPETVGQYTGLKDKNGTEIYEGDCVLLEGVGVFNVRYSTSMCQFGLYGERGFIDALKELQADRYVVVGNIYDNSELLTKTK